MGHITKEAVKIMLVGSSWSKPLKKSDYMIVLFRRMGQGQQCLCSSTTRSLISQQRFKPLPWAENRLVSKPVLWVMPRSPFILSEPAEASRKERESPRDKFMSSSLERIDASALFSMWLFTADLQSELCNENWEFQKASWSKSAWPSLLVSGKRSYSCMVECKVCDIQG